MTTMTNEEHKIRCRNCGYQWIYKGNLKEPTCPSCHRKTPNPYFKRSDFL